MYQNPEIVRANRTWVALLAGRTIEGDNVIHHDGCMVKFEMPEGVYVNAKELQNNQGDVMWFFLNRLDHFDTMSKDRMINAEELPDGVIELIPYFKYCGKPATIENYKSSGMVMQSRITIG
jgi:hypothetical protein